MNWGKSPCVTPPPGPPWQYTSSGARRPAGAAISEPEAILTLRHYLAVQPEPVRGACLAVISHGYSNGYYSFDAVNSCARTRLGRWRVDAKTRAVSR